MDINDLPLQKFVLLPGFLFRRWCQPKRQKDYVNPLPEDQTSDMIKFTDIMQMTISSKQINGIWHTGIVVYGKEFYYGGTGGIECCPPGGTILGQPDTIHNLGETQIPYEMFIDYLRDLSQSSYRPDRYHLLEHNCNTFSSDVAQFLTGNDIPAQITGLPAEVLATPFGQMIKPFIDSMSVQPSGGNAVFPGGGGFNTQQTQQASAPPSQPAPPRAQPKQQQTGSNSEQADFKPFIYEVDCSTKVTGEELGLSSVETLHIKEIYEYLDTTNNMWAPGREHLNLLIRLMFDPQCGHKESVLNVLARLALKEDIVHAFQHDPKSSFPQLLEKYEDCTAECKGLILKVLTNCCTRTDGCQLCVSEKLQKPLTSTTVSGLLDDNTQLTSCSAALCYNVICGKTQISEDTELEMGSALLTASNKELNEQTAFHILSSVCSLVKRNSEVKGLAGVLGINIDSLQTLSTRVNDICDQLKPVL